MTTLTTMAARTGWVWGAVLATVVVGTGCGDRATASHRMVAGPLEGAPIDTGTAAVDVATAPTPAAAPLVPPVAAPAPAPPAEPAPADPEPALLPQTDSKGRLLDPPDRPGTIPAPPLPTAKDAPGYTITNFDFLSAFDAGPLGPFGPTPDLVASGALERIVPEAIRKLHKTKIGLSGYMIPVDFEKNTVQTFLLCRWQPGCCFGHVPQAHEQIFVTLPAGQGTQFVMIPITVYGQFKIGREAGDQGGMLSLYRMTADKVVIPEDW